MFFYSEKNRANGHLFLIGSLYLISSNGEPKRKVQQGIANDRSESI